MTEGALGASLQRLEEADTSSDRLTKDERGVLSKEIAFLTRAGLQAGWLIRRPGPSRI